MSKGNRTDARADRLAAALRENLKRRKAQTRLQQQSDEEPTNPRENE